MINSGTKKHKEEGVEPHPSASERGEKEGLHFSVPCHKRGRGAVVVLICLAGGGKKGSFFLK